jgi:hypothetical protein
MINRWHVIVLLLVVAGTLLGCGMQRRPLPRRVAFEAQSSKGDMTAVVYLEKGAFDMLGGDDRAWLAIQFPGAEYILRKELTEGSGSYEGGVFGLRWLSDTDVLVERAVADQWRDIVYNTEKHSWREVGRG